MRSPLGDVGIEPVDCLDSQQPIVLLVFFWLANLAGDLITSVTRDEDAQGKKLPVPELIPTKGMSTNDAVKIIQGKAGTAVKLTAAGATNIAQALRTMARDITRPLSLLGIPTPQAQTRL